MRLGVTRTYLTRHGPGPFVTEDPTLEIPEPHNADGRWQGAFRTGHLDAVALRYAVEVAGGVDAVALTHLDTAARHRLRLGVAYEVDGQRLDHLVPGAAHDLAAQESLTRMLLRARPVYSEPGADWPGIVEAITGAPVALRSCGAAAADKVATVPANRAPAGLPEQLLHLTEPWMPGVTQPFEQHHLRGHDLGAVLAGPVEGGIPVGRVAGADGVRDQGHPAPGGQQGKHGLQHADVRLDARDQDLAAQAAARRRNPHPRWPRNWSCPGSRRDIRPAAARWCPARPGTAGWRGWARPASAPPRPAGRPGR